MPEEKIGAIVAELKLNSAKFGRGVKRAQKSLDGLNSTIKKMGTALLGAVGVGALTSFASKAVSAADSIGKMADAAGISTTKLQQLRFAFDLAGVGAETTDRAILGFGKRLGKARVGFGAMAETLRRVDSELLKNIQRSRSTEEALDLITDAMADTETQAERLAIAEGAFGDAGLAMTNALKGGSKAFRQAQKDALRLGIVLDENLIRNAEQINDDFTKLKGIIGTQLQAAFLALAPAIGEAAEAIIEFIRAAGFDPRENTLEGRLAKTKDRLKELQAAIKSFDGTDQLKSMFLFGDSLETMKAEEKVLKKLIPQLEAAIDRNRKLGIELKRTAPDLSFEPGKLVDNIDAKNSVTRLNNILKDVKPMPDPFAGAKENFERLLEDMTGAKAREEFEKFAKFVKTKVDIFKPGGLSVEQANVIIAQRHQELFSVETDQQNIPESRRELEKLNEQLRINKIITEALNPPTKDLDLAIDELKNRFNDNKLTLEEYNDQVKKLKVAFGEIDPATKAVLEAIDSLNSRLESGMTDIFQGMINGTIDFKEAMIKSLLEIQREIIRTLIIKQLLNAAGNFIGGFFGGGTGGGAFSFHGGSGLAGALAEGGPVSPGRSFLVGERGPEIFTPSTSGRIIPNDEMGGGDNVEINLNVTTGVQDTVKAEFVRLLPEIKKTVTNAIADKRRRGGEFSRAMGV